MSIVSYPVFVTFKHTSDVSILVIRAGCSEVLNTGDHLIVLLELPRLKYIDNKIDIEMVKTLISPQNFSHLTSLHNHEVNCALLVLPFL